MAANLNVHRNDASTPTPHWAEPGSVEGTAPDAGAAAAAVSPARLEFAAVYAQHFDFACRSLRLLGVAPDALEDAAQDVFGVVSRRLGEFNAECALSTWLFAIVQRVASNHRRTQRRKRQPLEPLTSAVEADDPSPEACAQAAQAASLVQRFCDGLDEGRRAVFVLALVEQVPARDIAPLVGAPLFTVYSRIRSLRDQLQRFLEQHEVEK
jgi:RNA polymerase sigma-70 factor (ECF subfamily)